MIFTLGVFVDLRKYLQANGVALCESRDVLCRENFWLECPMCCVGSNQKEIEIKVLNFRFPTP